MENFISPRLLSATLPAGFLIILLLIFVLPSQSISQPDLTTDRSGFFDSHELEVFIDGLMHAYLESNEIAGATVAVTHGGELLFSGGYGWADEEARKPVDPEKSLFRIGSVSKLFTWIGVMQLRDAGELDLDTDINEYLDFRIPSTYDQPITLRHLMTHTPGFEDRVYGLFGTVEGMSFPEWLERNLPARVRPPGEQASYSNYGTTLAGYIVERLSGMSWEDYVEQKILQPLGMDYATTRQPVPDDLEPHLANGYHYKDGRFVPQEFDFIKAHAAAGGMSTSAESMSRFMMALLQGGKLDGERILESTTLDEMLTRDFVPDPRVNAMALGFYEMNSHGLRILGHGGGTMSFFTDMAIIPEEDLGIFVSFNSPGGTLLSMGKFRQAVLDRFYPPDRDLLALGQESESGFSSGATQVSGNVPNPEWEVAPGWEDRAGAYEGIYLSLRRSFTTFEKPLGLAMGRVSVEALENGEIITHSMMGTHRGREIEPGYFRATDGHSELAFIGSPEEGFTHLYLSDMPVMAFERQSFGDSAGLHLGLLLFSFLVFISLPVVMVSRYFLQLRFAEITPLRGPERWLRWTGIAFLLLIVMFVVLLMSAFADQAAFMAGEGTGMLRAALLFPVLSIPVALALTAGAVYALRQRLWNRWSRAWFTLVALVAVIFLIELFYWNLLGWNI